MIIQSVPPLCAAGRDVPHVYGRSGHCIYCRQTKPHYRYSPAGYWWLRTVDGQWSEHIQHGLPRYLYV